MFFVFHQYSTNFSWLSILLIAASFWLFFRIPKPLILIDFASDYIDYMAAQALRFSYYAIFVNNILFRILMNYYIEYLLMRIQTKISMY